MKSVPISSIMTKNVVCVEPNQKIIDVKHIYEKKNFHHHIPVTVNGKLKGMVSLIDFMYNIAGAGLSDNSTIYSELTVKDIMTTRPYYLTSNATIEDAAKELEKGRYHAIPILENDNVVGIVSTADIIKYFLSSKS